MHPWCVDMEKVNWEAVLWAKGTPGMYRFWRQAMARLMR